MTIRPPLVVVGSLRADIVVDVDRFPSSGETIAASCAQTLVGGRGANQASCAARLSHPTYLCGQVGSDAHAALVKDALASAGVRLDHVKSVVAPTGHAVVMVQQNAVINVGGANVAWPDGGLAGGVEQLIKRAGGVLLQREIPDAVNLEAAKIARSADVPVIMDAGGADSHVPDELLKCVSVLSLDETGLGRLTAMSTSSLGEVLVAAAKVQETGVKDVLVKMGKIGAVLVCAKEPPVFQPANLDTTFTSDVFTAAFAVALIERQALAEAVRFAAASASVCSRSKGTMPERKAVLQLLKEHPVAEENFSTPNEKDCCDMLKKKMIIAPVDVSTWEVLETQKTPEKLKIGIVGFGNFGQFLAERFCGQGHGVVAFSRSDYSDVACRMGVSFHRDVNGFCDEHPDVVMLCTSILSTESVLRSLPLDRLKCDTLFVDVLSVKEFAKQLLLSILPLQFDVLCTHPMFGPKSGRTSWAGLPFVYEKVRIREGASMDRCTRFVNIFASEGCRMVEMSCEDHDVHAAGSQFITHTVSRILGKLKLETTPMDTRGYETLLRLAENGDTDSFDLYYGLFVYNPNAVEELQKLERAFECLKEQLFGQLHQTVGDRAFLAAKKQTLEYS